MANQNTPINNLNPNGVATNSLKDFQISGNIKDKTDEKYGEKIVLQCETIINSSYFTERNTRFEINRNMYAGRMSNDKFKDQLNIDGKTNYVNLFYSSIMMVNTIVNRMIGRWMQQKEKAVVSAVDPISINEKKEQVDQAEFLLYNKEILAQLQEQSGVQMLPQDGFIPDDKDDLDLWAKEELRIPEEILYEKGINGVMDENGWGAMGVNTRKIKIDSAVVGLIGAETVADKNGKIHINYCKPENMFYSFSEYADFRDASIRGEIVSYTMGELRNEYPKLSMEDIWEISKGAKQYQENNKITPAVTAWSANMALPVDDWTVNVARFTLKSLDTDRSILKKGKDGRTYVDKPKKKIEDVFPGNEYVEKQIWNIYRGVYVRGSKKILEWGLEKNMVKPQDYERISEAESPYRFYMYQNDKMRNLAIPEKIEEPINLMALTRLRIQQLIAKMRPSGYQYDIDGLQAMDLGNGIVKPMELQKITDQTGNVYYRGRDAEGNRLENPVRELPNSGSVQQIQALIELYNYHLQVLRDEIGSNEFAEGQTIKPRVGAQNVQTAMQTSFNATDYINEACVALNGGIAENIACLLHDSVEFGAEEYRRLMKEQDVKKRVFNVKIEMLPSIDEINQLENSINNAIATNPGLALYMNPEKIKRIARSNVKQAELYFYQSQRRAIRGEAEKSAAQQQQNGQIQQKTAQQSAQMQSQMQAEQIQAQKDMKEFEATKAKELALLNGLLAIMGKGLAVPQEWTSTLQLLVPNVAMPILAQNEVMQQQIGQMQQAQQEEIEGQEAPQEQQMEQTQEQPM